MPDIDTFMFPDIPMRGIPLLDRLVLLFKRSIYSFDFADLGIAWVRVKCWRGRIYLLNSGFMERLSRKMSNLVYHPLKLSDMDRKCAGLATEILGYARNPFSWKDIRDVKPDQYYCNWD